MKESSLNFDQGLLLISKWEIGKDGIERDLLLCFIGR